MTNTIEEAKLNVTRTSVAYNEASHAYAKASVAHERAKAECEKTYASMKAAWAAYFTARKLWRDTSHSR